MLYYHFSNNLRMSTFFENIKSIANFQKTREWEHSTIDQRSIEHESIQAYELYFGLSRESHNVDLVLDNKIDVIIAEFIKKFQFPNPRKTVGDSNFFELEAENEQELAPARLLLKLMYFGYIYHEKKKWPINVLEKYILANPGVAKNEKSLCVLYDEIENDISTYNYNDSNQVTLATGNRISGILIQILVLGKYIVKDESNIIFDFDLLSEENKDFVLEIIKYNSYFDIIQDENLENTRKRYITYMQSEEPLSSDSSFIITGENASLLDNDHGINRLYFGAPGTGKSYEIETFIKSHGIPNYSDLKGHPNVFRTTLHPEYAYNDFVGQIMPIVKNIEDGNNSKEITYEFKAQIFTEALKRAVTKSSEPVFLIMEEMSRSNVSAVFGDIFQLLDRNEDGVSDYRINNSFISQAIYNNETIPIYIPNNLFILGTVNTNDQNVFVMDTAFKRRFEFEYVDTQKFAKKSDGTFENNYIFKIFDIENGEQNVSWIEFLIHLNSFIVDELELSEDKQVGQFFIKFKESNDVYNKDQLKGKLLQYLWSDIQEATYSDAQLFVPEIKSFGQLYRSFNSDINIFSMEFLEGLNYEVVENVELQPEEDTQDAN